MEENLNQSKEQKNIKNIIINIVSSLLIVFLAFFLFLKINFKEVVVNGQSMYPTLVANEINGHEYGYTDRFLFKIGGLDRYDIVVIKTNDDNLWIKRIIGLPNETIQIKDGKVYINNNVLEDDIYCDELINDPGIAFKEIKLNDKEYFVMGDNRNHSTDSRSTLLGVVKYSQIYGRGFISRGYCPNVACEEINDKHSYIVKGW